MLWNVIVEICGTINNVAFLMLFISIPIVIVIRLFK